MQKVAAADTILKTLIFFKQCILYSQCETPLAAIDVMVAELGFVTRHWVLYDSPAYNLTFIVFSVIASPSYFCISTKDDTAM